jgi:hypothetical protein
MDEWVGHERIISPPSVAAAELKAQKEAKVAVKKEGGDAPPFGGPTDESADPSRARRCVCVLHACIVLVLLAVTSCSTSFEAIVRWQLCTSSDTELIVAYTCTVSVSHCVTAGAL